MAITWRTDGTIVVVDMAGDPSALPYAATPSPRARSRPPGSTGVTTAYPSCAHYPVSDHPAWSSSQLVVASTAWSTATGGSPSRRSREMLSSTASAIAETAGAGD